MLTEHYFTKKKSCKLQTVILILDCLILNKQLDCRVHFEKKQQNKNASELGQISGKRDCDTKDGGNVIPSQ